MANLRVVSVNVIDSTTIIAQFTDKLDPTINATNISVVSQDGTNPSPTVLTTSIVNDTLTFTTQPLVSQGSYYVIFQSTSEIIFKSLNGTSVLFQDGITNKVLILGPIESENPVLQFLQSYLKDNIYNATDSSTVVYNIVQMLSTVLSKALYDIKQVKNENYISFSVNDELKVRGSGPFDRLSEESAYKIVRVGKTPTGTNSTLNVPVGSFPIYPVSLLANSYAEQCLPGIADAVGIFNLNDFILTVSNQNVSKLTSVVFTYTDGRTPYTYNIDGYGYQILDAEYDQSFAFAYQLLGNNQFKLSESILSDSLFSTQNIFSVQVNYEFRNFGRIIDSTSVEVTTILTAIREPLPPIINVFNLSKSPIVDSSGDVPTTGGVSFIDPNALGNNPHPAFVVELPFNLAALPYAIGQYAIDYSSATVYVYGSDSTNSGTGPYPPLATYNYLYTYQDSLDYTYDSSTQDLVSLPTGNLADNAGTISFNYEQVLIPGVDYNSSPHVEVLSESIDNRLLALNVLSVENAPVTDVFRIYNQTSGEIYGVNRWDNNKVYFTYNSAPNVQPITFERASFNNVLNEVLFVNLQFTNSSNIIIFKCLLNNNNIISSTEDSIASKINTSAYFSNTSVFKNELWWDGSGVEADYLNIDRLTSIGEYQIDYQNGIVYVAVATNQDINIGTISYKSNEVIPTESHLISVDDIYYRVSLSAPKDKVFTYDSFGDTSIVPLNINNSDEGFLNQIIDAPYQIHNGIIGAFVDLNFITGVTNNIKFIRSIYEYNDLQFNTNPINFAQSSTFNGQTISVANLNQQELNTVLYSNSSYYLNLDLNLPYLSPNITMSFSVTRISDNASLWNGSGTVVPGSPLKLTLPGINNPQAGDLVSVSYTFTINDLSRIITDYNRGDFYVDYSYLADEIIISYEYGDNVLDFRKTNSLNINDNYYVSYQVGALRDALLKNFGSLINIPELTTFDIDLERERYRDAVTGALESFIIGPTVSAMKTLVQTITHIEPELIESAFQNWSLGSSLLNPIGLEVSGAADLVPGKYATGLIVRDDETTITFPLSSNLKLEQGSFQAWISPDWDGIDNNSPLTVSVMKDGNVVPANFVFLGAAENHPEYNAGTFTFDKNSNVIGIPNMNKDGVFIYYTTDSSGLFDKWYFNVVDGSNSSAHTYTVSVSTNGLFYNVKSISFPQSSNITIQSRNKSTIFKITSSTTINDGITFIADYEHFILDFGKELNSNRLSLYKDTSGYLNFRVFDNQRNAYAVSADVSSWQANQFHHVAISWELNTKNNRDELHLFVDGFEVPNIGKFGDKTTPYLHEKFRTINPEEIAGVISKNIVGSTDLVIVSGSATVSSSLDFSAYGINVGDTIFIDEVGFNSAGYQIVSENGNDLTLNQNMPLTLTNGRFSINRTTLTVETEVNIYPNITISTISDFYSAGDLVTNIGSTNVSSASTNFSLIGVVPGDIVRIDHSMFDIQYTVLSVSGSSLVLSDTMPETMASLTFHIYHNVPVEIPGARALNPSYSLSYDGYFNNQLTLSNNVKANDLILISTLGLNHRRVKSKFYVWGNESNVIKTRMPSPIDLGAVHIYHVLLDKTLINSSNATITGNSFSFTDGYLENPSPSDLGRTLQVSISTTKNLVFPLTVMLDGYVSETLTFNDVGTLLTNNKYTEVFSITVNGTCINASKNFLTLAIQESNPITYSENSTLYPVVRYSYQTNAGTNLFSSGGSVVTDNSNFFSTLTIGSYLVVSSPSNAAGTYQISAISDDHFSMTLSGTVPAFTNGVYQVLNTTNHRTGLQNGYFVLEQAAKPGVPYLLNQGTYEFDFYTYLSIKLDPIASDVYLGSNIVGKRCLDGILDEVKITSIMLTDTRVGETVPSTQESITKDFNSIKALTSNINTLMLAHFDVLPLVNSAPFYTATDYNKQSVQLGLNINDNFGQSLYLTDKPLIIENDAVLDSKQEGTIEFWVNPIYDTGNDPNFRYYFDATGIQIENVTSIDNVTVQTKGSIKKVLSITLQSGDNTIDYFAGGKVEFSTVDAISENTYSINASTAAVSKKIAQVITVKIMGDATQTDYFDDGAIGQDGSTIFLGKVLPQSSLPLIITYKAIDGTSQTLNSQVIRLNKRLPSQNSRVTVTYIPSGLQGDRFSIFKDPAGYVNFSIRANSIEYLVRAPAYWPAGSWHRLKASYSVNSGNGTDTLRLFVDGYEYGNILFGENLIFGGPYVFGSTFGGIGSGIQTNIKVSDFFGELYVGNSFKGKSPAYCLVNNLRISDISRQLFKPFGESIDVNYNSNLAVAIPVTSDLYTTLLLDFNAVFEQNQNFIMLTNKTTGMFDFSINIFDSFDIVKNSAKTQELLETLINILKPANSRVFIKYLT